MRNPKLLAFMTVLMLGLLTSGLAYAHWSQTLYISGSIATGELKLKYLSASADDSGGINDNIDIGKDKDVGRASAWVADDNHVEVLITNAYPCYETYVHFTVKNVGTSPAYFKGFWPQPPFEYDPSDGRWKATLFDGKITVHGWNGIDEQLDSGWSKDYTVWIHVEQSADENTTYEFEIEVRFD